MNFKVRLLFTLRSLSFLRAHLVPILFWPVLAIIFASIAWFWLLKTLNHDKDLFEQHMLEAVAKVAESQAAQTTRSLVMVDQMLQLVRVHWLAVDGEFKAETFRKIVGPEGDALNISIFDASGRLAFTNRPTAWAEQELSSVTSQPFFAAQKDGSNDEIFIGVPRKQYGQPKSSVRFSRKIIALGGFAGIVVVVLDTDTLVAEYDNDALGKRGFVSALGWDGTPRAVRASDGNESVKFSEDIITRIRASTNGQAYAPGKEFGDGTARYLSWQSLGQFPLTMVAAADQSHASAVLKEREQASIRTAVGATIMMAAFAIVAAVLTAHFAHQRYHLSLSHAAYRRATEGGKEGFYICQPVRDGDKIVDYITLDCNARGAELLNAPRSKVVGSLLSQLHGHLSVSRTKDLLDHALEHGENEMEISRPPSGRGESRQFSLKAVKSDDDVVAVTLRDITYERSHVAYLERKNHEDVLTGVPNRAWIMATLPTLLTRAEEISAKVAMLFIDLDGFKFVNDTLGHAAGDELLQTAAKRLKVAVRPNDHVVRLGGDEFVVVLENIHHESEAEHVASRILASFQAPFTTTAGNANVGTSIGISIYPDDADDVDTLYKHADIAMYEVKTDGKNRYQFFNPAFYAALQARHKRERELKDAINENQFVMYYQPRVDCLSGEVCSLEALVRWNHPTEGLVGPDNFIPLAEESGLILPLGELIIDMVCSQISAWSDSIYRKLPVSINVSSRQFNERDIGETVAASLKRFHIDPSCVEIELTESTMVKDANYTAKCLRGIHSLGVRLLVDDFGTGYSSLSMLHQMDFDVLKVDKSFTNRLGTDEKGAIFINAIITMAHSLKMRVVAEGVESAEQLRILRELNCDEIQGYYLYRPVPADELPTTLCEKRF